MVKPPLRTKSIGFKVSQEEYAQLETAAQASGQTLGEWCRQVILASDAAAHDPALAEIIGVRLLLVRSVHPLGFQLANFLLNTSNCCSSCPRMPSSYQVVLWKQESFQVQHQLFGGACVGWCKSRLSIRLGSKGIRSCSGFRRATRDAGIS
jgi:hypothetical protein